MVLSIESDVRSSSSSTVAPSRARHPHLAVGDERRRDRLGALVGAERETHLSEDNLVENLDPRQLADTGGKLTGVGRESLRDAGPETCLVRNDKEIPGPLPSGTYHVVVDSFAGNVPKGASGEYMLVVMAD